MDQKQEKAGVTTGTPQIEKLYMENTLLRAAGALFCHDPKRAATRTTILEVNRGAQDKRIVVRPDPTLGQPGPLAHKIFVALLKKHSDYGRPIQKEISFTQRELARLIGRKSFGGRDSEQLSRALHEIHHTFIQAHFRNKTGRYVEHSFNIFPEILIERREFASDPIESCTVTLAEPIVVSLQDEHFTCLNHGLMSRLGTIGQALYIRLFFHFANLYDGKSRSRLSFLKRYDDLCNEWLGGLTILSHPSKIKGEQLGPHLDQLVSEGFLASYTITKAKAGDGFVLTFYPGEIFFRDYDRYYRHRKQGELQFDFHVDRREISEPLQVARLFVAKRTGQPVSQIASFPSKDVKTAKDILATVPFDEIEDFINYGLSEARKTNFDVQTLGGLRQYLSGYASERSSRKTTKALNEARKAQEGREAKQRTIEATHRREAAALFATLSAAERETIETKAEVYAARFGGSLREAMLEHGRVRFTIETYGDRLATDHGQRIAE